MEWKLHLLFLNFRYLIKNSVLSNSVYKEWIKELKLKDKFETVDYIKKKFRQKLNDFKNIDIICFFLNGYIKNV